jgi:hypothetical protein
MTTRSVGTSYAPPSDRTRLSPSADEEQEGTAIITVAPTVVLVDRHPVSPAATAPAIEPALVVTRAPFSLLPDEIIIDHIFGFVGTGHYRYVAGTNRQFCNLYDAFLQRKDQEKNEADEKKTTVSPSFHCLSYFSCIVESISRTEMWLEETHSSIEEGPPDTCVVISKDSIEFHCSTSSLLWELASVAMGAPYTRLRLGF